jgi:Tfp pilus assembly protein PilF
MAASGAAVFLLHPLQVETVAWVSQRKNLLAMLFFLIAWELYCRYREQPRRCAPAYAGSLLAFVAAGLCKPVVVILPLVLLLDDFCTLPSGVRRRWLDKLPFLAIAAAVAGLSMISQQPDHLTWGGSAGGGMSGYHGGSLFATFLTMATVLCRYLGLILWPVKLSALYDHTVFTSLNVTVAVALIIVAVLGLLVALLLRQSRRYGFWALFFVTALLPVSQIIPLVTLMNDRYLYFPLIGIAALAGGVAAKSCASYGRKAWPVLSAIILLLGLLSFQRAGVWRDDITLWQDTVRKTPDRAEAWQNLALSLQASPANRKREAIAAFERSYELQPRDTTIYLLGTVYQELKEYDNALSCFQDLLEKSPDNVMGLTALGNTYRLMGAHDKAEQALQRAHLLQPEAMQVVGFLARLYLDMGDRIRARSYYHLLEKEQQDAESSFELACLYGRANNDQALVWLEKALQRGYRDTGALQGRSELAPLRTTPSFARLMAQYFPPKGSR